MEGKHGARRDRPAGAPSRCEADAPALWKSWLAVPQAHSGGGEVPRSCADALVTLGLPWPVSLSR